MKEETKAKMLKSKADKKARLESQTVTVDDNWRIRRSDPFNWEVQYKKKFQGYYPSVSAAIRALPAKMLNEDARGTLTDVLRSAEGIVALVERAIP
jgi:hypothetical protein